jgi:dipeptidyl aminopeptidase/acylaminoacyl peptidase
MFGQSLYGFEDDTHIVAACIEQGVSRLGRIDLRRGGWTPIPTDRTDFELDAARRRLIAVREDHRSGSPEPRNSLVAIACDGDAEPVELAAGHDFYAAPRLSPDGRQLAWLAWNHPSMPFFDTELWLADVAEDGSLVAPRRIAGGIGESLAQPQWSPDGRLCVVSDRSGWWNLYRVDAHDALEPLCPMAAEFAHPQWVLGQSMFGFNGPNEIIATCIEQGVSRLGRIELATRRWTPIASACTDIDELRVGPGFVAIIGGSPRVPRQVVRIDLASGASTVLASSVDELPTPDSSPPRRRSSSRARARAPRTPSTMRRRIPTSSPCQASALRSS